MNLPSNMALFVPAEMAMVNVLTLSEVCEDCRGDWPTRGSPRARGGRRRKA